MWIRPCLYTTIYWGCSLGIPYPYSGEASRTPTELDRGARVEGCQVDVHVIHKFCQFGMQYNIMVGVHSGMNETLEATNINCV